MKIGSYGLLFYYLILGKVYIDDKFLREMNELDRPLSLIEEAKEIGRMGEELKKEIYNDGYKVGFVAALHQAAKKAFYHCNCSEHSGAWQTFGNCKAVKEIVALKENVA